MNSIEDIMKNNIKEHDGFEPNDGHLERFEAKLEQRFPQKKTIKLSAVLKIAAIAVLALMSGLWIFDQITEGPAAARQLSLSDVSVEYAEVEMYFTNNINKKINELNTIDDIDIELTEIMEESELASLDSLYLQLQQELALNPGDERIIDAMINIYQSKLHVISNVLEELKRIKNKKTQSHENYEI